MKKLIQLVCFFFLLLPIAVFAQDSVTISGKIKNVEKYIKDNNSIQVHVNDIILGDQLIYNALIKPDGTFNLTFPKDQTQEIFMKYNDDYVSLIVSPGDKLFISMDADNVKNSIEFSGDGAETNMVYNSFLNKYNKFVNPKFTGTNRFKVLSSYQKDSSAVVFKKFRYDLMNEEIAFCNQFIKENKTTELFRNWAKYNYEYDCANDLMRYRWIHQPKIDAQSDYFDFFDRFALNNPQASISSYYGWYVHEYQMHIINIIYKPNTVFTPPINELITRVLTYGEGITSEEKAILLNVQKKDTLNISLAEKSLFQKVMMNNFKILRYDPLFEFIALKDSGYLRDILMSNNVYHQIKSKYSDGIGYEIIMFKKLVSDEKIKQKILTEYKEGLAKLNSFKLPTEANLNTLKPATSNDNIFQNLIEKYKGKVIYIDFWATWCSPCRAEMPNSKKLQEELKSKDVVFLYLGNRCEEKTWKSVIAELDIKGEHYLLTDNDFNALAAKFQITGIPHYVLVDKHGRVRDDKAKRPGEVKSTILALLNENL